MELLKGIIAEDLFLYLSDYQTFIISDIHIGYEESLNRQGILVPRNNYNDLMLRMEKAIHSILKKNKEGITKIIINGDIIHEFGKVSKKEKELVHRFLKFLREYGIVIVLEGNHDKALRYFLTEDVELSNHIFLGDILVIHGDKLVPKDLLKKCKTIIIGHEHPAVTLKTETRAEKYKCFLKGKYEGKNLIVTPSCNLFLEGTDILREKLLSPILRKSKILDFEVYVAEGKVYDFGKARSLQ